jgi:hypothetical protein
MGDRSDASLADDGLVGGVRCHLELRRAPYRPSRRGVPVRVAADGQRESLDPWRLAMSSRARASNQANWRRNASRPPNRLHHGVVDVCVGLGIE